MGRGSTILPSAAVGENLGILSGPTASSEKHAQSRGEREIQEESSGACSAGSCLQSPSPGARLCPADWATAETRSNLYRVPVCLSTEGANDLGRRKVTAGKKVGKRDLGPLCE